MALLGAMAIVFFFSTSDGEEACLVKYDTNDTSIRLNFAGLDPDKLRGEPGAPGKRGPAGPPGPIGGSESDTVLRQRYDAKIRELEARMNALSDPDWYLCTNGFRYRVMKTLKTFPDAEEICRAVGGHLATVGMRDRRTKTEILSAVLLERLPLWVGLTDLERRHRWEWIDGVAAGGFFTDWDTENGEPNNHGGNERCVNIIPPPHASSGKFNDISCTALQYPLCEKRI